MSLRLRKIPTASGATAIQIVTKRHGKLTVIEHLGSAHTPAQLGLLKVWLTPGFMPPGRRPFGEQAGLLKVWLTSRLDKFQEG